MESFELSLVIPCTRIIGNLVSGDEQQTQLVIDCGLIPVLRTLLIDQRKSVRADACFVTSNLTAGSLYQVSLCIENGLVDQILDLLRSNQADSSLTKEATWAICNCTEYPEVLQCLQDKGAIQVLNQSLR